MKKVNKPWGYEEILVENSYLVKRLVLKDETSTHYHTTRNEIIIPVKGKGIIMLNNTQIQLTPFTQVFIKKKTQHKIIPEQTLEIIEVSDKNIEDVIRTADKHGRVQNGKV